MIPTDYSALDRPEISMNSFYPRANWTPTPEGAVDYMIPVDEGISLSCRFFPVAQDRPTILFFYGNGETAADYDGIAPLYRQLGANFFVADYRGYGNSSGTPAFSTMLADAHQVLAALRDILTENLYSGPVFVMGRSMGRHAAFELAARAAEGLAGVIIESGRPTLGQFTYGLTPEQAQSFEADYQDKVSSISLPALVIHGEQDTLAPVQQAISMYESFDSQDKRLLTIPGAGHNDLLYLGLSQYFEALRDFVTPATR
ncbi:MAG: alpha/beta hydrolase [Dehalococcoidia bacterium]